jgi:AraC family transcriptional regulator of adaptative response / DNA-3-methyladenine glycosylase II
METIGVSPQSYIRTHRLLSAKVLLTDTDMNVSDIALTVGYGSVSRFNAAFKEYYKLTPKQLRKKKDNKMNYFIVKLSYRPPYNWKVMMSFLKMRLVDKVEEVVGTSYRRTLEILHKKKSYVGWIQVSPNEDKHYLEVRVDNRLSAVLMQVIKQVKIAFDLDACLDSEFLTKDIRLPGCFNTFEMSVRAILGQQITVKAAHTLSGRLVRELGGELETPYENLTHVFPSAQVIASCDDIESVLGPLGIIKSRANAIYQIAKAMSQGALDFNEPYDKVYEYLIGLKGIGPWTAEYLSMRGSHWPDAFPVTDIGIKHAIYKDLVNEEGVKLTDMSLSKYKLDKEYQRLALIYAEKFRPFRSYLTISLWNQLGEN